MKNLFGTRPFRRFYIKTAGGNYVEVESERHIMVAPPSHDLIIVSGTDGLVHHHRLATEHGGSSTLAYVQFESAEKVIVSGFDRIATGVMERKKKDVEIVRRTANH